MADRTTYSHATDRPGGTVLVIRKTVERPASRSMLIRYAAKTSVISHARFGAAMISRCWRSLVASRDMWPYPRPRHRDGSEFSLLRFCRWRLDTLERYCVVDPKTLAISKG
jgi:hypothetical protein